MSLIEVIDVSLDMALVFRKGPPGLGVSRSHGWCRLVVSGMEFGAFG